MPQPSAASFVLGLGTALLVIAVWLVVSLLGTTRSTQLVEAQSRLAKMKTELATDENQQTLEQYEAIQSVIKHTGTLRDQRFLFVPIWQSVKESVPSGLQIETVSMSEDRVFRLSGKVKDVGTFGQFSASLGEHKTITEVTPLLLERAGDRYSFQLSFQASVAEPERTQ